MIPTRLVAIQNLRFVRNPCICFWLLGLITIQKLLLVLYAEFNAIFILYISFLSLIMLEFDCNLHSFLAYGFFYSSSLYSLIYFPYILVTFFFAVLPSGPVFHHSCITSGWFDFYLHLSFGVCLRFLLTVYISISATFPLIPPQLPLQLLQSTRTSQSPIMATNNYLHFTPYYYLNLIYFFCFWVSIPSMERRQKYHSVLLLPFFSVIFLLFISTRYFFQLSYSQEINLYFQI